MIVEPDFVHHWKTELLRSLLGEPTAEAYVIRFWSFCQLRKEWVFPELSREMLAGIVRWKGDLDQLWDAFVRAGFLEEAEEGWRAHDWAEVNGTIVRNWVNGGRRKYGSTQTGSGLTQGGKKAENRQKSTSAKVGSGSTQTNEKPVDSGFGSTQTGKTTVDSSFGSSDRIGEDRIGEEYPSCSPSQGKDRQVDALPDLASDGSDLGELRRRLCARFGHSGSLPKDGKVNKAWKALVKRCALSEADVELLEFWYGKKKNPPPKLKGRYWTRTSVLTLLRNWERDLAFVRELCDEIGGPERAEDEPEDEEDDQAALRAAARGGPEVWERRPWPQREPVPAWPDKSESDDEEVRDE